LRIKEILLTIDYGLRKRFRIGRGRKLQNKEKTKPHQD
jgi:hypothetical protein